MCEHQHFEASFQAGSEASLPAVHCIALSCVRCVSTNILRPPSGQAARQAYLPCSESQAARAHQPFEAAQLPTARAGSEADDASPPRAAANTHFGVRGCAWQCCCLACASPAARPPVQQKLALHWTLCRTACLYQRCHQAAPLLAQM